MNGTIAKWYDFAIKGKQNEFATSAPVKIFVMGDNVWRAENEFPLARTSYTNYYLHAIKGARSASGDGVMSTAASPSSDTEPSVATEPSVMRGRTSLLTWIAAGAV
jgi:predicted acyl esterase